MNTLTVQLTRNPFNCFRLICNVEKITQKYILNAPYYGTAIDTIDAFTMELLQKHRAKVVACNPVDASTFSLGNIMVKETNAKRDVSKMTTEELDNLILNLLSKNKDNQLMELIMDCQNKTKTMNVTTLKKLLRNYSIAGKPEVIEKLQSYSSKVDWYQHKRNGLFQHYLAEAQCMKGNSDKGLSILTDCYKKYENLRSVYRILFRGLIQDSVLNRSVASLVIFKKYVLEFSENYGDHYPLVCFWHMCWSSTWFSDQMLSNDLLEASTYLQKIVKDKATAFSISALRQDYNEDAVVRLLQSLLKYHMMAEYVKVLQVLFGYKLRSRDIRGCTEIIRNCETLGVDLPADQQGLYINMLIQGKHPIEKVAAKPASKNFKLKF